MSRQRLQSEKADVASNREDLGGHYIGKIFDHPNRTFWRLIPFPCVASAASAAGIAIINFVGDLAGSLSLSIVGMRPGARIVVSTSSRSAFVTATTLVGVRRLLVARAAA